MDTNKLPEIELYNSISGLEHRSGQIMMLERIGALISGSSDRPIKDPGVLLCQAPTGTGKSHGLLIPALASWLLRGKMKTVICTGTHVLQDQMMEKDIPFLRRKLSHAFQAVADWKPMVLKGRSSYICPRKVDELLELSNGGNLFLKTENEVVTIDDFKLRPLQEAWKTDRLLFEEDDPLLKMVASDRKTCLGTDCPFFARQCPYYKAMRIRSPLIITNHSMLTGFLSLPDEPLPEEAAEGGVPGDQKQEKEKKKKTLGLLDADIYCFDEAHHLMGYRSSGAALNRVPADDVFRLRFLPVPGGDRDHLVRHAIAYDRFLRWWIESCSRTSELAGYRSRDRKIPVMRKVIEDGKMAAAEWEAMASSPASSAMKSMLRKTMRDAGDVVARLRELYLNHINNEHAGSLFVTPDEIALYAEDERNLKRDLVKKCERVRAVVATSGTLLINGSEETFVAETGLRGTEKTLDVPSPFTYDRVSVWIPKDPPPPGDDEAYFKHMVSAFCVRYVPDYVRKGLGGVLFLSSSFDRMRFVAGELRKHIRNRVFLVQGERPKRQIVKSFVFNHSSVLVGSSSFREGFDAPLDKLTWVIIDRLPFVSKDDPVHSGRIARLKKWGVIQDEFAHSLNLMKFHLIQSVGRLIRTENDWGTLTILDSRVYDRPEWGLDPCFFIDRRKWYTDLPSRERWLAMLDGGHENGLFTKDSAPPSESPLPGSRLTKSLEIEMASLE